MVQFGLSNALVVFMCLMNGVFQEYLDKIVIVFLDDILVYSKSEEEHEHHFEIMLQVLREHQLYAKLSKCSFYQKKNHFLGHIISKDGIAVDPKKIEAITEWLAPKNVTEVRPFMDIASYYRRFIEGFSKIAHPITSLQMKGKENKVVDALSRRVHEMHATTISMYQSDLKHIILEATKLDLQYKDLVVKLQ
jgi:hypothetical protein